MMFYAFLVFFGVSVYSMTGYIQETNLYAKMKEENKGKTFVDSSVESMCLARHNMMMKKDMGQLYALLALACLYLS